jgi:hypothetical protein
MENDMSDIADAIYRHLRTMAPHQLERLTAIQLKEAADEIARLRANLRLADAGFTLGPPTLSDEERQAIGPVDFGGLTDKEREAIETAIRRELAAEWYGGKEPDRVVALRGLLERTK